MSEQQDLFGVRVAEAPSRGLSPRIGAGGVDAVATLDEEATLEQLLTRCGARGPERLAARLLSRFGGIGRVLGAPPADLAREAGEQVAIELGVLHALLVRALEHPLRQRPVMSSWTAVRDYLRARLGALPREAFHVLFLDRKNQLIADERMGEGSVNHAPVYPREVVRRALELSASSLLLAHNHPSGDPAPSSADIDMTRQVVEACRPLGIAVYDHFIVGGDRVESLKTLALM
ncbi:JAB domain-containing protein [Caulobacter sp. KR2-114]|uniref:JAB domain-containing protein n=1 Tax=Caulobacter sp. KR2-114 TaxID=3400912 RepID=UPI003C0D7095